ncbi:MAG TPA: hypothetical protein VFO83_05425, partial [Aggregicoccus sp.]|nr:hypothetical protein [Aggregicoccus sp.]
MFAPFRVLLLPLLLTLAACASTVDPGDEQPLPDPGADGGLPVDTQLLEGPTGTVASPSARFTFSSNVGDATFECSLDGAAFAPCTSPADYAQLADGAHTFRVRALLTGAADQTPATRSWSVDTVAPHARISSGPSGATAASSATFTFTASDAGALECALDDAAFTPCTSPQDYTGLPE